jgi:ubiquitin carboxyl-terminal hydrolase 1
MVSLQAYDLPRRLPFLALNIPRSSVRAIKPIELINALSIDPEGRTNPLLCSREHQDAQELFQLLSECLKREATAVDKEGLRDRGLGAISKTSASSRHKNIGSTVFEGLTANRRSCVVCGYTEAVMHFSFDNWQLAVPRVVSGIISRHSSASLSFF